MPRILAFDYGTKRTGIAVTDPLQIIATALTTVHSKDILIWLADYYKNETVTELVIGEPRDMMNRPSAVEQQIVGLIRKIKLQFPELKIERYDERFTSKIASQTILDSGLKKKDRQNKELVDSVSAVIILQSYLESRKFKEQ